MKIENVRARSVLFFSILNCSLSVVLRSLEVALALPRSHHLVELALLGLEKVQVMLHHIGTEALAGELAPLELGDRLAQRGGHAWQIARCIDIALEDRRRLDLVGYSIQAGRDRRGVGDIRVGVGARKPALDPQRRAMADHPEPGG